uniref:Uncharacterized protein n=1 Tax=Lepeophtheirus salmonis TaxID=72036 RepID=A0A0K2UVM1_LEPSM
MCEKIISLNIISVSLCGTSKSPFLATVLNDIPQKVYKVIFPYVYGTLI